MCRPKTKKISRKSYCQYLLSTQTNYTLTNYADHVHTVTHDAINRYLRNNKLTPKLVWEHVKDDINYHKNGYIIFDDSVLDKNFSRNIESVRWQYSGNAHGVIRGIGFVSCVYVNPETNEYWVIDYRIFDPQIDGKSKMDHLFDMLNNAVYSKEIIFSTVLIDSWYSSNKLMLKIYDLGKRFYCPVKKNRLSHNPNDTARCTTIDKLQWTEDELVKGKPVRLKGMPKHLPMKMYQVAVSANRTDYVVTNDPSQICKDDVQKVCGIRWYIERFHREVKQVTGIEKCQCRKRRIQRNHITCALLVWIRLRKLATESRTTVYQLKHNLLKNYLMLELANPKISMSFA